MDKIRMSLTTEELALIQGRLVPISPLDYTLHNYSTLRNLYGRIDHKLLFLNIKAIPPTPPAYPPKAVGG